jgi:hypothetical protein
VLSLRFEMEIVGPTWLVIVDSLFLGNGDHWSITLFVPIVRLRR